METKIVIDIKTLKEIEIPKDYIECSVCGGFFPKTSYMKEGETNISRTNCYDCYMITPYKKMEEKTKNTEIVKKSIGYTKAKNKLFLKMSAFGNSISVEDLINQLKQLNPTDRVYITQEGYYADGKYADIFNPILDVEYDNVKFYSIGNSSQDY